MKKYIYIIITLQLSLQCYLQEEFMNCLELFSTITSDRKTESINYLRKKEDFGGIYLNSTYPDRVKDTIIESHYQDIYETLSNIDKLELLLPHYYTNRFVDTMNFWLCVYDSLVYIDEMSCFIPNFEQISFHEPVYNRAKELFKNKYNLYDYDDNKSLGFVLYFSKEYDGCIFVNAVQSLGSDFIQPLSKSTRDSIFTQYAKCQYVYNDVLTHPNTTVSFIFMFALNESRKMEYVDHIFKQY